MQTDIKILRGVTIYCQKNGCGQPATHLFRSGKGPICAYCERHAEEESSRIGLPLPMDKAKVLHAGW